MAEERALATADFRVYGTRQDFLKGEEVDTTVHFELHPSGAFDYGNKTCMIMKWKGCSEQLYDTRYEKVSVKTFKQYALKFLQNYIAKGLKAEPIEAE